MKSLLTLICCLSALSACGAARQTWVPAAATIPKATATLAEAECLGVATPLRNQALASQVLSTVDGVNIARPSGAQPAAAFDKVAFTACMLAYGWQEKEQ